ncbi:hypothetical protein [uncultured Methanobrevibacter sp.]|uniref:hypothetical protein n=1 Tax=uncultured Methanobrevibacter sp. TaxID=253161 RepID=UPI0026314349|nr:hypothetical protein [uncultured Methanobrevibacter sp.]
MIFRTFEEYDKELKEIESTLDSMEKRLDEEPYSSIRKGNYRGFQELYKIFRQDRDDFLEMLHENVVLHLCKGEVKCHNISLLVFRCLFDNFIDLIIFISDFVKKELEYVGEYHDLMLKDFCKESIQIVFSMDTDISELMEVYLNHEVFSRLLDLIDCDVEDLEKQKEVIGTDSMSAYKKFLKIIIDNELDFTLENKSRKVGLTCKEARKIYDKL